MKKYILISLLIVTSAFSQKKELIDANNKFNQELFPEAIKLYEDLVKRGDSTAIVFQNIADSYYYNANYDKASLWYKKLYKINSNISGEYLYRFGQSLKSANNLNSAKEILKLYAKKEINENRSSLLTKYNGNPNTNDNLSKAFKLVNLGVNSKQSDYGSTFKGDTLIFASARVQKGINSKFRRTLQPFTNLYYTVVNSSNSLLEPKLFSSSTYSKFHESTPAFSKNGLVMYFTQNEVNEKGKAVNGLYKIYKSVYNNGKWSTAVKAQISEDGSSRIAHPAFSFDEKYLYFASDMTGTIGQSDIFKVKINDDGSYGKPENLGININTEGRESYPFVTSDNKLVFASDGHPGFGGFDIFVIDLKNPNAMPINLGTIINSPMDDFAMVWDREKKRGTFSSNRVGGAGDDDIYLFNEVVPFVFEIEIMVKGSLQDDISKKYIEGAQVVLLDSNDNVISKTFTDVNGNYSFGNIKSNQNIKIKLEKEGYETQIKSVSISDDGSDIFVPFYVTSEQNKFQAGIDISSLIKINKIYFDVSKFNIRDDAKIELDKIVLFLITYPDVKIEIGSHTDSRQSSKANQILSQKRANATLNYIVGKGINKDRLTAKGYGESKLLNKCADGVKCSEAEHQENRRSTFIVVK